MNSLKTKRQLEVLALNFLANRPPIAMPRAMWRSLGALRWLSVCSAYLLVAMLGLELLGLLALAGTLHLSPLVSVVRAHFALPIGLLCCLGLWLVPRLAMRRFCREIQRRDFSTCLECG